MSTAANARTPNSYAGAIFRPKVDGQLLEGLEALLLAACRPRNAESQFPAPVTAAASQSSYWIESKHCLDYRARTVADMHRYGASDTFKPDAGPWPEEYPAQEVKDQRARGKRALEEISRGLSDGRTSFKFECGVYRVDAPFEAAGVNGLSICAQDVEIILEATEWCAHFQLLGCTDVRIHGPLILDSAPFGFSQGTIMGTQLHPGQPSFLDIQLHEGYPFPSKGHRITFFNPNTGVMIAHYQDVVQSVAKVDNDKIRLEFSPDFISLYKPETKRAVRIGNLICLENTENMRGGFEIRDTTGLELLDVNVHAFSLLWALPLSGSVKIQRYRGCRRPGTNRLMGGGFPAFVMYGGSVHIEDCEFAHNFDDLTDIGSELGFAFKQVASNQMFVGFANDSPKPGKQLTFYNNYTLEETGSATVTHSKKNEDKAVNQEFWAELKKASVLTWDCIPYLVTLDRDVAISALELVDCPQARPESLTIINSYLHDSLAAGVSLKGAKQVHIQGNVIERAGYRAVGAGFDPYWWEGGVPSNITILDNHIIDTPYNLPDVTPAINIYVDAAPSILATAIGKPIHGVHIANNTIVNPRTAAVGVAYTQNAAIMNNTIVNPMAAGLQTAWGSARNYEHPSAILFDAVENVCVAGNRITVKDLRLVPEVICATPKTDNKQIRLQSNTVTTLSGLPQPLPNEFFERVSCYDSAVRLEGNWQMSQHAESFSGRVAESCCPGASASFTWSGSRGRVFGSLKHGYGAADIFLDGELVFIADFDALPPRFAQQIGPARLANQLIFDSGPLSTGKHELVLGLRDRYSPDSGLGVGLEAFDFLGSHLTPHT